MDVFDAVEFAARAHRGQYRKSTKVPYIIHPLRVAKILVDNAADERLVIAGLLHDTLEDTPTVYADISFVFGENVATIVELCSEADKSQSWEERKEHTISIIPTLPEDALIVTLADKIDNTSSMVEASERLGEIFWNRFKRGKESQAWYHQSILKAAQERTEADSLEQMITQYETNISKLF